MIALRTLPNSPSTLQPGPTPSNSQRRTRSPSRRRNKTRQHIRTPFGANTLLWTPFGATQTPVRSPRVLTHSFTLIPAMSTANDSVRLWGFGLLCSLTLACGLTRFLFVGQELCRRLPSDSALRQTPLALAMTFPLPGSLGTFTL